ncbi:MAG: C-GCAxxG-C-C family (seleno)protein [Bacillota bacterium]
MDFSDAPRWACVLALILAVAVGVGVGYAVTSSAAQEMPESPEGITEAQLQEMQGDLERNFSEEISALEGRLESLSTESGVSEVPDQPWPYVKLDVEEARKRGHQGYYEKNCGYGPFYAIVSMLREEIGYPYDQIPMGTLSIGGGGLVGEESVCGTVLGTVTAISLIVGDDYGPLAREVIDYYKETPLPTDTANEYAKNHEFLVDDYLSDAVLPQSIAGSVDCDKSKEVWIDESGYEMGDDERKERCARMTGDMAAKAVEVLNAWYDEMNSDAEANVTDIFAEIFPEADFELLENEVYEAVEGGEAVGYATIGECQGHEDIISVAVGVDIDGTIRGVRIVDHAETAGIGDVIEDGEFLDQFEGLSETEIATTDEGGAIDAISGATVSTEAVVGIVADRVEVLQDYLD